MAIVGCSYNVPSSTSFFSSLPEGVTLIDEVKPSNDKVVIPYTKYQLENGLTVILSPDHSDPLVHVDVTYHVGSAREQIGKSGFAHFFEHMMFQGSEHVGDQQ
ncbi:M16 family metallopeptidase, partial [Vibrio sp. 10N.222.55.E8]